MTLPIGTRAINAKYIIEGISNAEISLCRIRYYIQ